MSSYELSRIAAENQDPEIEPLRVVVMSGDQTSLLGLGYLVDYVTVHAFCNTQTGAIVTVNDPQKPPTPEEIAKFERDGYIHEVIPNNPFIRLDNGPTIYGCQCWWALWEKIKPLKPYWYEIYYEECAVCGNVKERRTRRYSPKPQDPAKRHHHTQVACSHHFL